jgi:hypothetical protein
MNAVPRRPSGAPPRRDERRVMRNAIELWLVIVVESAWMLLSALLGRYGHVRATSSRVRSTLESAIPDGLTRFERQCLARARRRRAHGIEL